MCWGRIGHNGICRGETRWWQWNPPAREFLRLPPLLYKQVEVRQGQQDEQAGQALTGARSLRGVEMSGCSSKSLVLVSLLGLLMLLLCGRSKGGWAGASGPWELLGSHCGCAHSLMVPGQGRGEWELFQQKTLPNSPLLSMGSCIVRGLKSEYPGQPDSVVQIGFIYFVVFLSFQRKATRIAACLTPECVCLGGPSRVILNSSPAKSVISMQSCKLLFRRSSVFSYMC